MADPFLSRGGTALSTKGRCVCREWLTTKKEAVETVLQRGWSVGWLAEDVEGVVGGGWPRLHGYFEPVRNGFKSFSKSFSNVAILQAGPAFACSMAFRSDALSRFDEMIFQEI